MAEKVTTMVLTVVNLDCCKCYKKVKKVLCTFPEIQDQVYDEKNNKVTIKVVCCSPEKIKNKILCKGGRSIKSIEIVKQPEETDKFKMTLVEFKKTSDEFKMTFNEFKKKSEEFKKTSEELKKTSEELKTIPVGFCCSDCYMGRPGGPCYNPCYGQLVRCYDVHCAIRPVYDSWGGGGGNRCYPPPCRCSECFFEVNSQGCTIM